MIQAIKNFINRKEKKSPEKDDTDIDEVVELAMEELP